MDQQFLKVKSLSGNTCANVFTNGWVTKVHETKASKNTTESLCIFSSDAACQMHSNLAAEVEGRNTEFQNEVCRLKIQM